MNPGERKRRPPILAIVLALALLAGGAVMLFQIWPKKDVVVIRDLVALDSERALLLRFAPEGGKGEPTVALVRRAAGVEWAAAVPNLLSLPGAGVARLGERVALRTFESGGALGTVAWSLADGSVAWRGPASGVEAEAEGAPDELASPATAALLGDAHGLLELYRDSGTFVVGVDADSGAELWRSPPVSAGFVHRAWLAGGHLALHAGRELVLLAQSTGERRALGLRGAPCVVDGVALLELDDGRLRAIPLGGGPERTGRRSLEEALGPGATLAGLCARHGGTLVAAVQVGDRALVVGLGEDLEITFQVDLGARLFALADYFAQQKIRGLYPESVPLSGSLSRFVPVILRSASDLPNASSAGDAAALVMLDLERRQVAWSSTLDGQVQHHQVFSHGGLHLLVRDRNVAVIDGGTGRLRAAARIEVSGNVLPYHLADGTLWVHGRTSVAALDVATLSETWHSGDPIALDDTSAAVIESLPDLSPR